MTPERNAAGTVLFPCNRLEARKRSQTTCASTFHQVRRRAYGLASFLFLGGGSFDRCGARPRVRFSVAHLLMPIAAFIITPLNEHGPMPILITDFRHIEI